MSKLQTPGGPLAPEVSGAASEEADARSVAALARAVVNRARTRGLTLAAAESLTGGEIAAAIVSVPGASDVFPGGIVSYAARIKEELLGVPGQLIADSGTVNAEVAARMAEGVRRLLGSDLAVATTGVAGPGPNEGKPAGTVYLACADASHTVTRKRAYSGSRAEIREASTADALALLLEQIR